MTKAKPVTPKSQASTPKGNLKGVKNTPIGKNKTPKFKATPTGKVALINGTPKSANKQNTGNGTPKGKPNNSPAGIPKTKVNTNLNTPNSKRKSLPGTKNTPKGKSPAQKKGTGEQLLKAAKNIEKTEDDDESDDSDEDINEGVEINEEVSDEEVDSDAEDESDDDDGIKGILGNSLAEDSDDDDADFDDDDDDDDEDEETENKGVKRFKGLQPNANDEEDEDEDDDDDDSSAEDDDDDSLNDSGPGLKALLGKSLAEDDDDEDFSGNDDEEDEDDDDISDDEDNEVSTPDVKNKKALAPAEDDDDEDDEDNDDDDEEDSDDDEDDTETSKLSISANDSEDDDEEDEDEDDETESNSKDDSADQDHFLTPEEIAEREKRTIYVGNLPTDVKKSDLTGLLKQFGPIDTIRIRGAVGKDDKTSKKVAVIKKELHPIVQTLHAFVRFAVPDSATKALALNGHKLRENFLRLDLASGSPKPDVKKAVFLGNLPFRIQDNDIWQHFADCGKILSVRIVRDSRTGVGKGFGYVNFESPDSVALALKLSGTTLQSREIRVQLCSDQPSSKKQKEGGQKRPRPQLNQGGSPKKRKDNFGDKVSVAIHNSQNAERRKEKGEGKQNKRSQGEQQRQTGNGKAAGKPGGGGGGGGFQGQKADNKKKQKFSKDDKKKKQIAAKFTNKSKKPSND